MKINDVEKLLGITKANIRFYEKEGLLSPSRTENGYREYSSSDVALLKQIVILRKLGIPVQQIADILDGALPLQEALEHNIQVLNQEIEKLNGALGLCHQLQAEDAQNVDTDRYWDLIHQQEQQGLHFAELVDDYLKFTELQYAWLFWPLPIESFRSPWKLAIYVLLTSAFMAIPSLLEDGNYLLSFVDKIFGCLCAFILWTAVFAPVYLLSKKKPKLANGIMTAFLIAMPVLVVLITALVLMSAQPA